MTDDEVENDNEQAYIHFYWVASIYLRLRLERKSVYYVTVKGFSSEVHLPVIRRKIVATVRWVLPLDLRSFNCLIVVCLNSSTSLSVSIDASD